MEPVDRGPKLSRKSSMIAFVVHAFELKGGRARLSDVYPIVKRLLREHHREIPTVEETVRSRVYNFCPEASPKTYIGPPLFHKRGKGEYELDYSAIPRGELSSSLWEDE